MSIHFSPVSLPQAAATSRAKAPQAAQTVRFGKVDEDGNWENKRFDKLKEKVGDKVKGGAAVAGGVATFIYMPTIISLATGGLAAPVIGGGLLLYGGWKLGAIQAGGKWLAKKLMS